MKMVINAGISKVYYIDGYPDSLSMELVEESHLSLQRVDNDGQQAVGQP